MKHQDDNTKHTVGNITVPTEIPELIKCKGPCDLEYYSVNKIKKHLGQASLCKSKYSMKDFLELENQIKAYRKWKLQKNYQNRKKVAKDNDKNERIGKEKPNPIQKHHHRAKRLKSVEDKNLAKLLKNTSISEDQDGVMESGNVCSSRNTFNSQDTLMEHIYHAGCEAVNKYCGVVIQNKFYKRLEEKVKIDNKLNQGMDNMIKSYDVDEKVDWLNNLCAVYNSISEKISHHTEEFQIWKNIWISELKKPNQSYTSNFSNKIDLHDDIKRLEYEIRKYYQKTDLDLCKELETTLGFYLPEDKKIAIIRNEGVNQESLKFEVESLLHYINYRFDNVYKFCVQYIISLAKNIGRQMKNSDKSSNYAIITSLEEPDLPCYESLGTEYNRLIKCVCGEIFFSNTIKKHFSHPRGKAFTS